MRIIDWRVSGVRWLFIDGPAGFLTRPVLSQGTALLARRSRPSPSSSLCIDPVARRRQFILTTPLFLAGDSVAAWRAAPFALGIGFLAAGLYPKNFKGGVRVRCETHVHEPTRFRDEFSGRSSVFGCFAGVQTWRRRRQGGHDRELRRPHGTVLSLGISKQRSYRMGHLTSDLPQGFIQRRQKKPSKARLPVSSYPQLLWSCKKIASS